MDTINHFGIMLWPLLACSITGISLVLERSLFFIRHRCYRPEFELMIDGDIHFFLNDLKSSSFIFKKSPLALLSEAFFDNVLKERIVRKDAAETAVSTWISHNRAPIKLMATLAQIAPLLGLTGTVLGLVDTFRIIQSSQNAVNPSLMAGGIWEALLTTIAGMLIAIPLILGVRFLNARIETVAREARAFFAWLEGRHLTPDTIEIDVADRDSKV